MDYLAKIEAAACDRLDNAHVLGVIFSHEITSHTDGLPYWERVYYIAWRNEHKSGTHQANVNSQGMCALFYGNLMRTGQDPVEDMIERAKEREGWQGTRNILA
jgi:hypothetical protein